MFTQKDYDHALYRFTSFISKHGYEKGKDRIISRIWKMTNPRKLEATKQVANDVGERAIALMAGRKLASVRR